MYHLNNSDELIIAPITAQRFKFYKLVTFDTESLRYDTDSGEFQNFFNFDAYDGEKHYYTEDLDDVYNIFFNLFEKYNRISFFAHHIIFDFRITHFIKLILNERLFGLNNKLKLLDSVVFLKYMSADRTKIVQYADSMNYFRTKLQNIAKMFNLAKTNNDEYNLSPTEWNKVLQIDGKERVQTDTDILYKALKEFESSPYFDLGITLASTSFNTFRKRYLKYPITFPTKLIDTAINVYHGGIVIPYKLVKNKKLKAYDINSLYPFVMANEPYSIKLNKERTEKKYIYDDIKDKNYNYLLKVKFKANNFKWSPVFSTYDNQLIPFLENEQWLTGNEVLKLYENDYDIDIKEIFEFKNAYLFTDFINTYYDLRINSKTEYEKYFFKIFLNSLYGKFGQHKGFSKLTLINDIENPMIREILQTTDLSKQQINGLIYSIYGDFVSVRKDGCIRYNPLIAGEITANARLVNFEYSKLIGYDNLYYTDTDSFFTNKSLSESNKLGKVKLEKSGSFTIYAPKDYEFFGKCGKSDCPLCFNTIDAKHWTLKGVSDTKSIVDNTYINKIWSGLKYKFNNDIYIQYKKQMLKRENKKLFYDNNIGREWNNINEYDKYHKIKDVSFLNLSDVLFD